MRDALNLVFRPEGGDLTKESPLLFDRSHLENLRIITADDQPVAHVGICFREAVAWGRRFRLALFGGVFTLPAHRGRGLASRTLADAIAHAHDKADLLMITGERDLYRRQGFDPVPPGTRFVWTEAASGERGCPWTARRAGPDDLASLAALHRAEPVRLERSPPQWKVLLAAGQVMGGPCELWLVHRGDAPVAYLAVQPPGRRADGTPRPARVLECAGDVMAIAAMAPTLARELIVPHYAATPFVAAFEACGVRPSTRQFLISAQALSADVPVVPWLGLDYV